MEARMRLPAGKWAGLVCAALVLMGAGAAAFACTNLATLSLSTGSGRPGALITLTGASFPVPRPSTGLTPTPVIIHWQKPDGMVLAEAPPDRYGSISASFTVPDAGPGTYVIVATQKTLRPVAGAPADTPPVAFDEPGTPARASFEVLGIGRPVARAVPVDPVTGSSDLDSSVWIVLTAAFGAVAILLFGGGLIAFVHQSRKAKQPVQARWVPPGW